MCSASFIQADFSTRYNLSIWQFESRIRINSNKETDEYTPINSKKVVRWTGRSIETALLGCL